jgi:hypothetical protein
MRFYGIADCKGLESFLPVVPKIDGGWVSGNIEDYKKEMGGMTLRAQFNRHRHAVVFLVEVGEEVAGEVLDLLDDGEYEEALVVLKEGADKISLARMPGAEKSWKMIPNPDLDPYG